MESIRNIWSRSLKVISGKHDQRSATQMLNILFLKFTGMDQLQLHLHGDKMVDHENIKAIELAVERLARGEPVQYITSEAYFYRQRFYVDSNVLIPRPETEELVDWIISTHGQEKGKLRILDIGTGSGCIAISLSRFIANSDVYAIEVDNGALLVAGKNNQLLNAKVHLIEADVLDKNSFSFEKKFDIIVSNPPYVSLSELDRMSSSTINFEPKKALFSESPLQFYRAIGLLAEAYLVSNGTLYFELNEFNSAEIANLMKDLGFRKVEIKKDMQGKNRMLRANI